MPCTIRRTPAGALLFEKTGGSQRFSGTLLPSEDGGFRLVGVFFCPMGACDQVIDTHFTPVDGGWSGELHSNYRVTVMRSRRTQNAAATVSTAPEGARGLEVLRQEGRGGGAVSGGVRQQQFP